MWQPERILEGPHGASAADIEALNGVFSDAFTDRYRRDGLVGVRVPQLNPAIWRYAIDDAGPGAMVWYDTAKELVAFNVAHCSGREGWMGPLAVRTDRQGEGIGRIIVQTAVDWLKTREAATIGLETMPRTVENIGFYSRLGFVPGHLTVTMTREAGKVRADNVIHLADADEDARAQLVDGCRVAVGAAAPGYDFSRELELTHALGVGDTVVVERGGEVCAFALYHAVPLADTRSGDELRVLKLFAADTEPLQEVLSGLEAAAERHRLHRVAIRCQTGFTRDYRALVDRGYRVRWTDLRMTLDGYPEPVVAPGAVVFSNWEI
jgi:GNAT superfamily N-acetyltransferase